MTDHGDDAASLTLCRTTQGRVRILHPCSDDPTGSAGQGKPLGYNPVQHLAIALGCCMTEFARRFLERRDLPETLIATLDWKLDGRHCRISRMDLTLRLATVLSGEDRHILDRMMNHCPVHQAMHGNVPVHIHLERLADEERRLAENDG
ncbi:OsmC family protein [Thioalkalivibrio nitratireducens DSM 14787]|uniref:OsmC family protein n=1 Tax=Thioalkalivibrio nitratireducens (strain DSM 14787 / UNIQEM 213 / ALEN2) TaxID=1255043 RepID=L0DV77_THIND|nr:OsmC family protein [Thioalkalivibrio nitratireducens]AGA33509.1 OsmC family protein [Thioalkalivibrio nitratireducens DSM 14787]